MKPAALKKLRAEVTDLRASAIAEQARLDAEHKAAVEALFVPVRAAKKRLDDAEVETAADNLPPDVASEWLAASAPTSGYSGSFWTSLVKRGLAKKLHYGPYELTWHGLDVLALIQKRAMETPCAS